MPKVLKSGERYTNKEIVDAIDGASQVSLYIEVDSPQTIASRGIEGLNNMCTEDIVDNGHLLEDICIEFHSIQDGKAILKVSCDADAWYLNYREN